MKIIEYVKKLKTSLKLLITLSDTVKNIEMLIKNIQLALGRIELRQIERSVIKNLSDAEFQVFSQWGEDGIIQYLIHKVPIMNKIFVEFGVENYVESNTRFLLQNNNWAGLIIDGSAKNIEYLRQDPIYWKYNLKAECSFVTAENINFLISKNGIPADIGLLSIDIDGNDYWVWKAIECISPRIVICEYNSLFGPKAKVTIPYDHHFQRTKAHYSNLYFGASIAALEDLAKEKGYSLVGSTSAGNDAFFVRNDVRNNLQVLTAEEAYIKAQFRESRDKQGNLTFLDRKEALKIIGDMPVFDIENGKIVKMGEIVLY
jgi:hypothetical protein